MRSITITRVDDDSPDSPTYTVEADDGGIYYLTGDREQALELALADEPDRIRIIAGDYQTITTPQHARARLIMVDTSIEAQRRRAKNGRPCGCPDDTPTRPTPQASERTPPPMPLSIWADYQITRRERRYVIADADETGLYVTTRLEDAIHYLQQYELHSVEIRAGEIRATLTWD